MSLRLRLLAPLAAVAVMGPGAVLATAAPEPDEVTRCAETGAVSLEAEWEAIRGPQFAVRPGGRGQQITAYAVHPATPERRFVTNGTSVERSDDAGCTWREVYALPDVPTDEDSLSAATSEVVELVIPHDPTSSGQLILVARNNSGGPRVLISPDGGLRPFQDRSNGLPPTGQPSDLLVAGSNPDFLYLGVRSPDEGEGDTPGGPLPDLPDLPTLPVGPSGTDPGAARGALYASEDGGRTWAPRIDPADPGAGSEGIELLAGAAPSANRLWMVANGLLRASTDGGRTFRGPGPSLEEQRRRNWKVTAVEPMLLQDGLALQPTDGFNQQEIVAAFSATSAQGGGPVLLISRDGGANYDETPAPGIVDAASSLAPGTGTLAFSTRAQGNRPAGAYITSFASNTRPPVVDVSPPTNSPTLAVTADRSDYPTLFARTSGALLRYLGVERRRVLPPKVSTGGSVSDVIPPVAPARLTPSRDVVRLPVGSQRTVQHTLVPPARSRPLDLYVLIDTSISMADDLDLARLELLTLASRLVDRGIDLSIGLGEFKGGESSLAYRKVVGVGPDLEAFQRGLGELRPDGYGLEAQLIALEQALRGDGERPSALTPAPCKLQSRDPDRYVLQERRTAPLVQPGQAADFRTGAVPVVLMVTDTNYLRPPGTRLKSDCSVDTEGVAADYARAGVKIVGYGIDDVDNPERAGDMLMGASITGALQPAGQSCAPELDPAPGAPAVCRNAVHLLPTLESLLSSSPSSLTVTEAPLSPAVQPGVTGFAAVDLGRQQPLSLPVTYSCVGLEAGTYDGGLHIRLAGRLIARLTSQVTCEPGPVSPSSPRRAERRAAASAVLPLVPPAAPPPPPAQGTQVQTQTQAQLQTMAQDEQQQATALVLAQQEAEKLDLQPESELAMSARDPAVPQPAWLAAMCLLTVAASTVALRRQSAARRVSMAVLPVLSRG
ncbi:MAG TPA: hypothetical protein VNA30_08150 [Mycobacteriales bacterium]|nr:hypothetical protein [Mycobacteriales bacterium]